MSMYFSWKSNLPKIENTKSAFATNTSKMKESASPIPTDLSAHNLSSHSSDTQLSPAHTIHPSRPFVSPGSSAINPTELYSRLGMDRIGQLFRANWMGNNNNSRCDDKNKEFDLLPYERGKTEQSMNNIKQLVENAIGIEAKQQIMYILEKISLLQPPERLLLYLKMPSSSSEKDPLRHPQNPLGTRSEINFTINWIKSHLEMDPNVSIPKQDVYDEYVSYCEREGMKPLSTADFGKVMKQIFPSLRPRRLGTRGNSRYCYAAMRKTTKLECPLLPNLNDRKRMHESNVELTSGEDDNSYDSIAVWNTIKTWAESILKKDFSDAKQLAQHITSQQKDIVSNIVESPDWISKKGNQKKLKNPMGDLKKRRRKKLKKTLSKVQKPLKNTEKTLLPGPSTITKIPYIKQERKNSASSDQMSECHTQDISPINLTNLKSEYNINDKENDHIDSISKELNESLLCKIEVHESDEVDQTILCKKVKRAQESKGKTVPPKIFVHEMKTENASSTSTLMLPPQYDIHPRHELQPTDLSMNNNDVNIISTDLFKPDANSLSVCSKRPLDNVTFRNKRLRFNRQASVVGMNETKVDDIATDIIIPRERVVSICNMEKDALDDYLNEGGDSQEQEAELLQYFQTANSNQISKANMDATAATKTNTTEQASNGASSACPILENYQLHQSSDGSRPSVVTSAISVLNEQNRIDELRQYLQQNLQQPMALQAAQNQCNDQMLPPSSTQRITTSGESQEKKNFQLDKHRTNAVSISSCDTKRMRIPDLPNPNGILDSKFRHFSFIPISPGPKSPLSAAHAIYENQNNQTLQNGGGIFQSPQKSLSFPKQANGNTCFRADPSSHVYSYSKNDISASAPVSPSITSNHFRFHSINGTQQSNNMIPRTTNNNQFIESHISQASQIPDSCSLETRSQSVPLYCLSSVSNITTLTIDSVSQSVSQTPVPSDLSDFQENGVIIDML